MTGPVDPAPGPDTSFGLDTSISGPGAPVPDRAARSADGPVLDPEVPAPPSPAVAAVRDVLRAARDLVQLEDVHELLDRTLALSCRLTGAGAGVLLVVDEDVDWSRGDVLRHGGADHPTLAQGLIRGGPETVALSADVVADGRVRATIRLGALPAGQAETHQPTLLTLAAVAGTRLDALRQREAARLYQAVSQALWELDRTLTGTVDLDDTLPLLTRRVREVLHAGAVALVARPDETTLRVLAAAGEGAGAALADLAPDLHEVLDHRQPRHWAAQLEGEVAYVSIVPLEDRGPEPAVLLVQHWRSPQGVLRQEVQDVVSAMALHASLVLDRELGEREHDLLTLLEDRDRIARDLHDLVIQRLFAVGLTLQGATRRALLPEVVERLEGAVSELDQTIRDIRATIFQLRHRPGEGSFRADLRALVESYAPTLGLAPVLHLHGPLDAVADDETHAQVLMVVREALSNIVRHARASSVEVTAVATAEELSLTVTDDGVGIPPDAVESGLGNVRARASDRGGRVELRPVEPHGTQLRWTVPL
ncbi:sensor histidine kinase [Ornithinimicrobium pratense]|uniref:Sensor histidine kinase n=1 Tax=Ornithinimicrobium pratense TaxID=2593973 RepID=A0A5J6V7S2_9MICO|nr:sensor histidine kinase [Ornithinimicrobium pratense]QFG69394.1 sensor histidine kinase [Ornithinimicrobium pratense]